MSDLKERPAPATKPAAPRPVSPKRAKFIGFAKDDASASVLHDALSVHLPDNSQIHVVDFRAALTILGAMSTPEIVLIDVSGEDQPINAMMELAEVVEPGTTVLAVGETLNVNFYRNVTKMGIKEYLPKPLSMSAVEKHFAPVVGNMTRDSIGQRGGRMVTVMGARGGVGTSTIATNLAWYIGTNLHRHTVLLDSELHNGTVALDLNLAFNNGLITALQSPDRVDSLLIERSMQVGAERLHVLAGQEALDKLINYQSEGAEALVKAMRARYNFVVADGGSRLSDFARDLSFVSQQRVIVMDPSMIAIRNLERLLTLPAGPNQAPRPVVVLNKAGVPGGLTQAYMEQTMGVRFDAVIPDLPRIVPKSTQFGELAASLRGPFRHAIEALAGVVGATVMAEAA
jgi:pilus assembly protein CpaE